MHKCTINKLLGDGAQKHNEMMWQSKPDNAWKNHIRPQAVGNPLWVEDSKDISESLQLSKRELFGLILVAHACNYNSKSWRVGYNPEDEEPNDGFIVKGKTRLRIEHKIVAQM